MYFFIHEIVLQCSYSGAVAYPTCSSVAGREPLRRLSERWFENFRFFDFASKALPLVEKYRIDLETVVP